MRFLPGMVNLLSLLDCLPERRERFGLGGGRTLLFLLILHDFLDRRYQKCIFYDNDKG